MIYGDWELSGKKAAIEIRILWLATSTTFMTDYILTVPTVNAQIGTLVASLLLVIVAAGCGSLESSREQQTRHRFDSISIALQAMYLDIGRFPSSSEGLVLVFEALSETPGWNGPYANDDRILIDGWGSLIDYVVQPGANCFVLYSFGPNQIDDNNSGDDISNESVCTNTSE